jgi:hypothetical protein
MKFNKNQKRTLLIGSVLIAAAMVVWLAFGAEIFTKTQVIIAKKDELFGTTYKEFEDKFILGLDYSAAFSFTVFTVTSVVVFFQRNKKES